MILDISKFKFSHPGGKFSLLHNNGRDVSKYFYGGYMMENNTGSQPHTHSNMARLIVNTLIVARLERQDICSTADIVKRE